MTKRKKISFKLTRQARMRLSEIARYTTKQWGSKQRITYIKALHACLVAVADDPRRGKAREDIGPNILSCTEGRHVIYYLAGPPVVILDILHDAMDPSLHITLSS